MTDRNNGFNSNFQQNTSLRTHQRLGDIIQKYNTYITDLEESNANFIPKKGSSPGDPYSFQSKYQYYHFQLSPQAIDKYSLGRMIAIPFTDNIPSWSHSNTTNTTNSWLVTLGETQQNISTQNQSYITNHHTPNEVHITTFGNIEKVINVSTNADLVYNQNIQNSSNQTTDTVSYIPLSSIFQPNLSQQYIDSCIASRLSYSGQPSISAKNSTYSITESVLSDIIGNVNCVSTSSPSPSPSPSPSTDKLQCIKSEKYICYEITSYFKPSVSEYYTFDIRSDTNTYVLLWFGDVAVADFTYTNSTLNPQTTRKQIYIDSSKFEFIRIQVYHYTPANAYMVSTPIPRPTFTFNVTSENSKADTSPFYSCISTDGKTPYLPSLLYAGFVSNSPDTYKLGEMQCYSQLNSDNTISYNELIKLYQLIQTYKFLGASGAYDNDNGSDQYGILPNGVYYTPTYNGPYSKPYAYSLYRISADKRMGNTYQIDTQINPENQYEMKVLPKQFIQKDTDYTMYERYYPTESQIQNAITTDKLEPGLPEECQSLCNQDDRCNYFYSFALNKGDSQGQMCYIGQDNTNPSFNQINPNTNVTEQIQPGSSNLYIRNKEFSDNVQKICKTTKKDESDFIQLESIVNTNTYGSSFPFSKYYISNDIITDPESIGICANKKKLTQLNNCFRDVLINPGSYDSSGKFNGENTCTFVEGFDNTDENTNENEAIVTDAIENTQTQGISYVQQQEAEFAHNMDVISQNYRVLNKTLIPQYDASRTKLYETGLYDENLKDKLTFVGKQIPNAAQQSIVDNNELYVNQNLLFILAVLTMAVLLVLMVVM